MRSSDHHLADVSFKCSNRFELTQLPGNELIQLDAD